VAGAEIAAGVGAKCGFVHVLGTVQGGKGAA
jgi:hypothetical protein